jgi:hypothetical protein
MIGQRLESGARKWYVMTVMSVRGRDRKMLVINIKDSPVCLELESHVSPQIIYRYEPEHQITRQPAGNCGHQKIRDAKIGINYSFIMEGEW